MASAGALRFVGRRFCRIDYFLRRDAAPAAAVAMPVVAKSPRSTTGSPVAGRPPSVFLAFSSGASDALCLSLAIASLFDAEIFADCG